MSKDDLMSTLYDLLEIDSTSDQEAVDFAHMRAVTLLTEEWTQQTGITREHLDAAHVILRNPSARAGYDEALHAGVAPTLDQVMSIVFPPKESAQADAILAELARDWPEGVPGLPTSVTEISTWQQNPTSRPPIEKAKPKKKLTRDDRKIEKRRKEALNAGRRNPSIVTRLVTGVMGLAFLGAIGGGAYMVTQAKNRSLPGQVGLCVKLSAVGSVERYIQCGGAHDGYVVKAMANPALCKTDIQVPQVESGVVKQYFCIERTK